MTKPVLLPENAITITRGSSKTYEVVVTDDDNGKPVDLTSARVLFTVKADIEQPETVITKDSQKSGEAAITLPREGKARIFLDPDDTMDLAAGEYVFDVWVILANGKRYPVLVPSAFIVQLGVTLVP